MSVEQNAKVKDNRRQIDGDIVDRQTAVVTGQFEHVGMEAEPPRQLCLCWIFNCSPRDAHQSWTGDTLSASRRSNEPALEAGTSCRTAAYHQHVDVVVELVAPEQFYDVFYVSDQLNNAQYKAPRHWTVDSMSAFEHKHETEKTTAF